MTVPVNIMDTLNGVGVRVSRFGQLIVAPIDYSTPIEHDLDVADVAFNFIEPVAGHSIVITAIIVAADKDVSVTEPASIEIFEADAIDSTTPNPEIINPQLLRGANLPLIGLNMIVPEGKWVNATTTDTIITLTLLFYRVPVESL